MSRAFTGRDMLLTMVGFFGLVITVNMVMAHYASSSFGGTVVENSYVASQKFNGWLQDARDQKTLGWQADQSLAADRHVVLTLSGAAGSFTASAVAEHPLGRAPDVALAFAESDGALRSTTALPPGRWNLRTSVRRGGEVVRLAGPVQ